MTIVQIFFTWRRHHGKTYSWWSRHQKMVAVDCDVWLLMQLGFCIVLAHSFCPSVSVSLCLFFLSLCLIFAVVLRVRQSRPEVSVRKPFGTDGSVFCRPDDHTGIVLMFSFFFSIFIVIIITVCRNSSYIRVYNSLGSLLHKCCIVQFVLVFGFLFVNIFDFLC